MRTPPSLVLLLLLLPLTASSDASEVLWSEGKDGDGDLRRGVFHVADGDCAYRSMADPTRMAEVLTHLEGVKINAQQGNFQDVTLSERFFLVGLVQSRYHRTVDGSARLEWELVEGQQARHDGFWQVSPDPEGATVTFENVIEAKSFLHRGVLNRIQKRAMADIVTDITGVCGV